MGAFPGTDRFAIVRRLGSGGFGSVFEAFDQERGHRVALKLPHRADALDLYLFKQEFRALADVIHPNLVSLFELLTYGDEWFFTMELVEGSSYLRRLRPGAVSLLAATYGASDGSSSDPDRALTRPTWLRTRRPTAGAALAELTPRNGAGPWIPKLPDQAAPSLDYGEVRAFTRQLAEGLNALHQAGKLHRDIKPSNVLVTPKGRVVLVDFGLAVDLAAGRAVAGPRAIAGTPAYMAPERLKGRAPEPASDWYSVGVMLYRVLTGLFPFPGENLDAVLERMDTEPRPPSQLAPGTPEELSELCLDLLARQPEQRPSAHRILERLGAPAPAAGGALFTAAPWVHRNPESLLVGRHAELAALHRAFRASRRGVSVLALVQGDSGMGKTYLVRHFLRELERQQPAATLILGRCYEQETVPYKALDSLVDALAQFLLSLSPAERASLLPRHLADLARLFPVLRQLEDPAAGSGASTDPQELRRRAFAAFRQLLSRLGGSRPLVLFIDDLQWGDRDSSNLLASLFQGPEAPPMLLVACHRSDAGVAAAGIRDFRRLLADSEAQAVDVVLRELGPRESRSLARALLPAQAQEDGRDTWIARESGGSPFFIQELSRQSLTVPSGHDGGPAAERRGGAPTLDQYLRARVRSLPESSRRVLEVLALAGQPVDREVLARACAPHAAGAELIAGLRAARLIRVRGQSRQLVETFHDRIREAVAGIVPEPRGRDIHLRLAQSLEQAPRPDPQALALHYHRAGDPAQTALYAELAGDQASKALAFERAAHFYRLALEMQPPQAPSRTELLERLGCALSDAGLCAQAAEVYQAAAARLQGHANLRLRRMAAEQLFRCGRYDQGLAELEGVLATLGIKVPSSPWRALVSALARRALARLRGLAFRALPEREVPERDLDRIDICWAGAMGLGPIDHIRGADFQARQLGLALRAGEPLRVVRALAHETVYVAHRGNRSRAATERILAATQALAERLGEPGPRSRAFIAAGMAALMQGRWRSGLEHLEQAEELLQEHGSGMDYELHLTQYHAILAQWILGDVRGVERRLPPCLQAARDKADLFTEANLRTGISPYLHLARDQPDLAAEELRQTLARWSTAGFHIQHYNALAAEANLQLYRRAPRAAAEAVAAQWGPLRRSLLLRVQAVRITMVELRARTALAVARSLPPGAPERRAWLRAARSGRRSLERERTDYGDALALKLQALEALAAGREEAAPPLLDQAEAGFRACGMELHVLATRYARGRLRPGTRDLEGAVQDLRAQGIGNPERFAWMHFPL